MIQSAGDGEVQESLSLSLSRAHAMFSIRASRLDLREECPFPESTAASSSAKRTRSSVGGLLGVLNVREFFEPGAAACGGGIGSSVRSCHRIERER